MRDYVRASSVRAGWTIVSLLVMFSHARAAEDTVGLAQKEKKVVVYHTTTNPDTLAIAAAFKKKYPFAEVEGYRGTGEKLLQRITTEIKAGQHFADVYMISGLQTWILKDLGLLNIYRSPEREKVQPALRDQQGYWSGVYWNLEVLGYNTKLVQEKDIPRKWEDLLLPRWKGQIALEEDDVYWCTMMLRLMGEEKGKSYARQLAKQQLQIRAGHSLVAQLLAAGEFHLTPTLRVQTAEDLKSRKAPVEWVAIEPLAPNPPVAISLAKQAPHANIAKLYIDFVLSQEGQKIMAAFKRNPTRTDVDPPVPRASKVKLVELDQDNLAQYYG
ncbi:MAG: ABC transporter substrate-binding protein, partial [Candidatus Binatia bacterium]